LVAHFEFATPEVKAEFTRWLSKDGHPFGSRSH
jgi:hypothetical protein